MEAAATQRDGKSTRRRGNRASALLERLQAFDFPAALAGAAGRPLQPVLGTAVDIACQKTTARLAAFGIGARKRSDIAAGAGARVLPGYAGIPAVARQCVRHS